MRMGIVERLTSGLFVGVPNPDIKINEINAIFSAKLVMCYTTWRRLR